MMQFQKLIPGVHITMLFIAFCCASNAFAVGSYSDALSARKSALKDLINSRAGAATEPARTFRTPDGYVRFFSAGPATHFPVAAGTAEEQANAFLGRWRNIFVNESAGVALEQKRVKTANGRSYIRYRQPQRHKQHIPRRIG